MSDENLVEIPETAFYNADLLLGGGGPRRERNNRGRRNACGCCDFVTIVYSVSIYPTRVRN